MALPFVFVRYAMTGGVATGVQYAVVLALVEAIHLKPPPAAAVGAACGALVAYAGNRRFVFSPSAPHFRALPRFLSVAALGVVLSGAVVWMGTALAWHYLAAQAVATAIVFPVAYCINRSWALA